MDASVVYVTAANSAEASTIGRTLVEAQLVACANVLEGVKSIYRWQGAIHEVPLTAAGQAQAQAAADYLKAFPIGSIYSSDLQRAWDTATTIGEALGISPHPDPRWREVNAGVFQGLTATEQRAQNDYLVEGQDLSAVLLG